MRTEMTGGRLGGGGGGSAIPQNARKVVQNLKEIATGHGEEEIYAMLKECNMDPNETAQRLMSQDTFHEVKRKKDRKKEVSSNAKEGSEGRSRGTGSYRGGRGGGRGVARYVSSDTNGRGKTGAPRENGSYPPNTAAAAPETKPAPLPPQVHAPSGSSLSTVAASTLPNGSVHYPTSTAPVQGSWSKIAGHATMAEMLKSNNALHSAGQHQHQHQPPQPFTSSGMYSSSDPVHHPFTDQRAPGGVNSLKRDIGIVGIQRPIGDRGGLPSPPSQASNSQEEVRPVSPPHEASKIQDTSTGPVAVSSSEALRQTAVSRVGNGRPPYQPQTAAVNKTGGLNLEWKPKLVVQDAAAVPGASDIVVTEALKFPPTSVESEVLSKFQNLSARDEHQQVIMPNNFQSQGDLGLSFGSFGESFGSSIPSGFRSEESIEVSPSPEPSVPAKDILHEQSSDGVDIVTEEDPVHHQDEIPAQRDSLASNTNASISAATFTSQADISKLRAQQAQQYSYLQSPPSYSSGIGMVSQIPSSQHVFDSQESHLQDLPSAPTNLKQQHYADSGASFYSPAFRPSSDADARYQYLPTNTAAAKYTNGAVVMTGQQHLPAHEVTTSSSLSSSSTASQSGITHSMPTAPQQAVPVHAYPAQPTGVPVGHFGNVFGYQYPGYTFMPSPYQHSYTTSYPQPPVSSYSPSANYTPAGVAAVKYPLPQYKPSSATANAPLTGAYGGYGTTSSMYAANPTATASNTPGYEDASGAQYKESNLYMHGPQGDGARLWQLSSDVAAQTSSFYTLSGQNQHTSYTQQPSSHTHPMTSYTSLYHHPSQQQQQQQQQQQAGANAHQMIQQPQALSGAAGSTQVGAATYHQQLQRMQQPNWNSY